MKTQAKLTISIIPLFAMLSGCRDYGPANCDSSQGKFYHTAQQCMAAAYYSSKVCQSGERIIPEGAPLPRSPCYYTEEECNRDEYYSKSACGQLRKPDSSSIEQDWSQRQTIMQGPGNR